jgi:hypothetical protein
MIEVNFNEIKRRLYADGCADLLRGVACLRWSLLAGQSYEQAVRPWKIAIPELFTKRDRSTGHRTCEQLPPRNVRNSYVRHH